MLVGGGMAGAARNDGDAPVADETLFDHAWEHWRGTVTEALTAPGVSAHMRAVLQQAGAFDAHDGLIQREWALGLMTDDEHARQLGAQGISEEEVDQLVALVQRHPTPAAGG